MFEMRIGLYLLKNTQLNFSNSGHHQSAVRPATEHTRHRNIRHQREKMKNSASELRNLLNDSNARSKRRTLNDY